MALDWINYHHLLYFWTVAREGSITKACEKLLLAQPTISGQLRVLEDALGGKLFAKSGRNLVLTEFGQMVYQYADEIFSLGRELSEVIKGRPVGRPLRLTVGVADVLPKLVVFRILEPVFALPERIKIVCHEDRPERLLAELSLQGLDLILSDSPLPPHVKVKAYHHLLGASPIGIYGIAKIASKYKTNFPNSLQGAPFLLPIESSAMRKSIDQWFSTNDIRPEVVGEFQDNALLKVFAQSGVGLFAAPTVIAPEIRRIYGAHLIGTANGIEEKFYVISVERRVKHPAVLAIAKSAHQELFAGASPKARKPIARSAAR